MHFSEVESYAEGSLKPNKSQLRSQINCLHQPSVMMRGNKQKSIPDQSLSGSTWTMSDAIAPGCLLTNDLQGLADPAGEPGRTFSILLTRMYMHLKHLFLLQGNANKCFTVGSHVFQFALQSDCKNTAHDFPVKHFRWC